MPKLLDFIIKHPVLLFAAAVFISVYCVSVNVALYGDDYYYCTFVSGGLDNFIRSHINHYAQVNGRTAVHFLITVFLALPRSFWRVSLSLSLTLIVFLSYRIIAKDTKKPAIIIPSLIILSSGVLAPDISITRESVYWLTGSLNYVYPILMLLLYWNALEKNSSRITAVILSFLSAATTEQGAMMSVGLSFLYLIGGIRIKGNKKSMLLNLSAGVAGACSVLLAPSLLIRYNLENSSGMPLPDMLRFNFKAQYYDFFTVGYMVFFHALLIAASGIFLYSHRTRFTKKGRILITVLSFTAPAGIALLLYMAGNRENSVTADKIINLSVFSAYYFHLLFAVIYTLFRYCAARDRYIPLFALLLCFGSQLMMIASPIWGARNALCAVFMLTLCSAHLSMHPDISGCGRIAGAAVVCLCLTVLLVSFGDSIKTAYGYAEDIKVDQKNVSIIREYRNNFEDSVLTQYKLIDENFGWSMPYNSPYHEKYYKIRYKLPEKLSISWVKFNNKK